MFDERLVEKFPNAPGVYVMKGGDGEVLYVGKAKNLRARVKHYFLPGGDGRAMIPYLMGRVESIETIIVSSEKEALLLENNLIKSHKPHYNIILKDDKGFISLMITTRHPWPMVRLVRVKGRPSGDGLYFGPYTSTYAARQTLELLGRLFPLRRCSDRELSSRTRPCILYQIKRCVAPCVGLCTKAEYEETVARVVNFLKGRDKEVVKELRAEMDLAAEALEFEKAQMILGQIQAIERTVEQQQVDQAGTGDRDILGIYREEGEVSLSQMLFRDGKLMGSRNYHFSSVVQENGELLTTFLLQHYGEIEEGPHEILLPCPVEDSETLREILSSNKRRVVHLHTPQKGDKKLLIEMAEANAKAAFHQERDERHLREGRLLELQEELGLMNYPRRIECFDNSSLGGTEPVSAMVLFLDGEKEKSRYRKYKIQKAGPGDDYGAMREVLERRLTRGKKEEDLPDLVVVDGGKGHLNVALGVLSELNIVTVDVIALTKEGGRHDKGLTREVVQVGGRERPVILSQHAPALFLLQQIRDEAHRFAITFQRKRRGKRVMSSALDNIPGIGPVKRQRLLQRFGSVKGIIAATDEALKELQGITSKDVEKLRQLGD